MKNKEIDYLMFTVKQEKNIIADVIVDLFVREYSIIYTDLYGQTVEPEKGGKLRRKSIAAFAEKLDEIDLVSMPVNETSTLPINMDSAMVTYFIKDVGYNTEGHASENLSKLHKEIEGLIGMTFGSYEFYK